MAQKVTGIIKLQINAAKATASPPVGPALGQHGVNIAAFIKEFNARTKDMEGYKIPVVIHALTLEEQIAPDEFVIRVRAWMVTGRGLRSTSLPLRASS